MRLMFVARALNGMAGGVERMIVALMNDMTRRGHSVSLLSWDPEDAQTFYPLKGAIRWYKLNLGNPARKATLGERLQRMAATRRMVRDFSPDVIVCFQGGPFMAIRAFTVGMGIPIIAAERTSPALYEHAGTRYKQFMELQTFRTARFVTIQIERYRLLYPAYLRSKIIAIPNPVQPASNLASPDIPGPKGRFRLLAVGRLSYQKNMGVLIDAFSGLAPRFPLWDLRIVGEGEERKALEAKVAANSELVGRVTLPGARADIDAEYAAAHLFCLPARWEGFPNALAEALSHGLPSVGFVGCLGVPDLIIDGQSGTLAPGNNDPETLSAAIGSLMEDSAVRARMRNIAIASMRSYEPTQIFDLWELTLRSATIRHSLHPAQGVKDDQS